MPTIPSDIKEKVVMLSEGHKPFYTMKPQEYRNILKSFRSKKESYQSKYSSIKTKDFTIPAMDGFEIPVRIYTNELACSSDPTPTLVYLLGGGFLEGDLDGQDEHCRKLSQMNNCTVIAIAYRLAPEYKYPAGFNDAYDSTLWVFDHADDLFIDRQRIMLCGYSSGANYAALISNRFGQEGLHKIFKLILINPCLDLSRSCLSHKLYEKGVALDQKDLDWHYNHYLLDSDDRKSSDISPLWADHLDQNPETLIITSDFCPFRDEGIAYAKKLREAGVNVVSYNNPELHVEFVFWVNGDNDCEKNPFNQISKFIGIGSNCSSMPNMRSRL